MSSAGWLVLLVASTSIACVAAPADVIVAAASPSVVVASITARNEDSGRTDGRAARPADAPAADHLRAGLESFRQPGEPGALVIAARQFELASATEAGRLAYAYLLGSGLGLERDERRARELLTRLGGPFRARGWYVLGLLDERSPVPRRNARAREWFKCAARAGDGLALNHLGTLAERAGDAREAARRYDAAARRGVPEAVRNQQRLRETKREETGREDIDGLRVRALAGEVQSMVSLARAFHRGRGVPADYTEALRWYREAALRGHPEARRMLDLSLANPRDVASIDPPWLSFLAGVGIDRRGRTSPIASVRPPLSEPDPLLGLETLHMQAFVSTPCEVSP